METDVLHLFEFWLLEIVENISQFINEKVNNNKLIVLKLLRLIKKIFIILKWLCYL